MLTLNSDEKQNTCFKFIGADSAPKTTHLISDNTSLISAHPSDGGLDTCSFYSGPSDAAIIAFGESGESCGSIAFNGSGESCGSIAFSAGESSGSVASSVSFSGGGGFSGGGCSYSC